MKIGGITITSQNADGTFPQAFDHTNWTGREIRGSAKGAVFGSWFGALVPAIFAAFIAWRFGGVFMAKNIPNPVIAVAALASLFSLSKAIWETVRLKRFGDPILELSSAPVPLGGTLEGRVAFDSRLTKAPEFTVTLACLHRVASQGSKNSSASEKILWSSESKTSLLMGGTLPISIAVPADQPQTNGSNPFDRIFWRLTVKARFFGPSLLEKYEVPVGQAPQD